MSDIWEMLLTSDASSNLGSACIWDHKTGTSLHQYKNGGVLSTNTAAFIRDEYFIAAERSKPLIHVWQINSQEPSRNFKTVCSGQVSALAVSPDGSYCAGGVGEQLHLWQASSGRLLAVAAKHFQPISKLQFSGAYLVSAAGDGLVLVWTLAGFATGALLEPLHVLSEHSLPVRDLFVSAGACGARILSVSADRTLQVHQLNSGELLLSAVLDEALTAVTCASTGSPVFVGACDGAVHEINLLEPPRGKAVHGSQVAFRGHEQPITALSVSADGATLASGSKDGRVFLWHILSRQRLRTIALSGSVTTLLFCPAPSSLFRDPSRGPAGPLAPFQRVSAPGAQLQVLHTSDVALPFADERGSCACSLERRLQGSMPVSLQQEIDKVRLINGQLYRFFMDRIVERADCQCAPKSTDVKCSKKKIRLE